MRKTARRTISLLAAAALTISAAGSLMVSAAAEDLPPAPAATEPAPAEEAPPGQTAPAAQTTPDATPEPSPDATPEPSPDATPVPSPDATPEPSPDATPEPSPDATPVPSPDVTPEPSPDATPEPSPDATPVPSPDATPEPSPDATPEPSPDTTPEPSPTATPGAGLIGAAGVVFAARPSATPTATATVDPTLTSSMEFVYYAEEDIDDTEAILPQNRIKFTVECLDTNKNKVSLPTGSVIPATLTFDTAHLAITADTFSSISIPGFTFDNGYAYYYWEGNYKGTKYLVPSFTNCGRISNNYPNYNSYIGFEGLVLDANNNPLQSSSQGNDYNGEFPGCYAYNPTGTLRVVFLQVDSATPYKVRFRNYAETGSTLVDVTEAVNMRKVDGQWQGDLVMTALTGADLTSPGPGYTFAGWYSACDESGNGTGTPVQAGDPVTADRDVYARWEYCTAALTICKEVGGDMGDQSRSFSFLLTLEGGDWRQTVDGLTPDANGVYHFTLAHGQHRTLTLPKGIAYTVTETDYALYGYGTAVEGAASGTLDSDTTVTYTNTRMLVPPTGLDGDTAPGVWLLLAGLALLPVRRRWRAGT
ncbi:MAG: hypothetical protein ACI4OI_02420 [Gemmiger sp.]